MPAGFDIVQRFLLPLVERAPELPQQCLAKPKDRVEGRAQFVAHVGEKVILGPPRPCEFRVKLAQRFLSLFTQRNIVGRNENMVMFADLKWVEMALKLAVAPIATDDLMFGDHKGLMLCSGLVQLLR